ncbi:fatty acid synthase-like [Coccinella septempunctata]|uniref:fatty acid synthase-like n=1 Tax=Coccinella septempunctata TaxID=41139 RepID=UPI001D086119|nr:fatty acid synthase-like [Coccinella septempunctata]
MKLNEFEVAISGVGGLFPKASNIEELKERLLNNEILLEHRWKYGERGCTNVIGKIDVGNFDNAYFGIHRQQCTYMDPMQRLVLERTFEALLDAGVNPADIRGRRIGCFMGSTVGENDNLFLESVVSGFGVTGHSRAMMPNRVSYWLNLKGPSVAYDSNWVSGIEILRIAFDAIKTGQCEACIVGTANLALNSEFQFLYGDMGLLSPDGSNKSFDAEATGYARSDGVVVFFVQRAQEAKRSYANIVHVATRFDGQREGKLLDIDVDNLTEFLSEFYETAKVDPKEVEFVEAYGSAIKETDKKEIAALERVFCKNRKTPLLIGSVKPNTGHSEASSAMFSIVKSLIALETETIPATLQYSKPNPEIPALVNGSIQVVTENRKWNPKYIAVNAIGLDSYYGHILLKANPKKLPAKINDLPRLLMASTRTEEGIKNILEVFKTREGINDEYVSLVQGVYSKPILGHLHRGYSLQGAEDVKCESETHLGNKRQIWFVYSGMGSQWAGMASDLMKIPVFNAAIQKCQALLAKKGIDLISVITNPDKKVFDNILNSFIGIAAIQIGLTDVLHSLGITPDGIIGHSVGELGCAYADGCVTAEQMIMCAYSRGKASLEAELIPGMMAAVGMGYHQIKDKCPESIEVACHNGPDSSTISGPTEDMEKFVKQLQDEGVFARLVNVSNIAYHSRYIKPAAPLLLNYLKEVIPTPVERSPKWISTSNLEENWGTDLAKHSSAEYHTNNLLSSVLFEEGLHHIPKDSVLIEIAPHGLLQAILKRSLKPGCTNVPLTQRGSKSAVEFLFNSLGKLYLAGLDLNIQQLYPKIDYPVSRGTPSLSNLSHWEHSETWRTGLEDKINSLLYGVRNIDVSLNTEEFREFVGHQLDDEVILPSSAYLNIVSQIIASISSGHQEVVFENLHFRSCLNIPKMGGVAMHAMIQKGSGSFEVLADGEIVVTGKMTFPLSTDKFMQEDTEIQLTDEYVQLSGNDIYNEFQHRGYKYSGPFKTIKNLTITEEGSIGTLQWNGKWHMFLEGIFQQYLLQAGERNQDIQVPRTIQKIALSQNDLPSEKCDLTVHYNYSTQILATNGIQVVGIQSTSIPRRQREISYDSIEFFPLSNSLTGMEEVLNASLYLAIESYSGTEGVGTVMITDIETEKSLHEPLKVVLKHYQKFNPNLARASNLKDVMIQQAYPSLFIYNDHINDELARITAASNGFILVKTSKDILSNNQLIQIAQWNVGSSSYSLLRKVPQKKPTIVLVKGETLSTKDFSRGSVTWVNELTAAASSNPDGVLLVSTVMPVEGLVNFVQELRSVPNLSKVCCFFNFDKRSDEINTNDSLYQNIYNYRISLSVLKDNVFGTYLPVPVSFKENILQNLSLTSNVINNKTIQYLSVNPVDETICPPVYKPVQLGNIDYSAVTSSGKGVMGLARIDQDTFKLVPDPIFCWDIPEGWNIQDGATVPNAFACAYYALKYKGDLTAGNTVLIHGGCTSIGMAAICIASTHGCHIYTTVANDMQRAFLKKHFVFLRDRQILNSNDSTFEPALLTATGGAGADIVMNCLSGPLLQASMGCLADYGKFIQYGKYDVDENNSIGMFVFLRNISFYVVDFNELLNEDDSVKNEIRECVQKGLEELAVRPLHRKVVESQDVKLILNNMRNNGNIGKTVIKVNNTLEMNKFNVKNTNQFICDGKSSYLIYGGSAEAWTDLAEWLILRGARRIIVASDSKPQQTHINRRLSLLLSYFGAEIVLSQTKPHSREGATELLSEVYSLGTIHMVFLLPSKTNLSKTHDNRTVQYIDHSLRTTAPKALFVNFINSAAGLAQARAEAGFNTYNIQYDKGLDFTVALHSLDTILSFKIKNIMIMDDKVEDINQETAAVLFKKLDYILPSSIEELTEQYIKAPKKPDFIQLPTLGPRKIRELAPIFVIPGLTDNSRIRELALELLYPTYCAVYSQQNQSISELANEFVARMKEIWPKGPYTLVGVSWGGALTMEIARILDQQKASIHVYLIDGAPKTLQMALMHLGENATNVELNLITRYFKINEASLIEKLSHISDWDSRVALALQEYTGRLNDKAAAKKALTNLRDKLKEIISYRQSEECLSGEIYLLRPSGCSKHDGCDLLSASKRTLAVHIIEGDHTTIVKSPETALLINQTFSLI